MTAPLTRRRLLAALAAVGLGAAGWRVLDDGDDSPEARLAAVLADRDAARNVGERYLDTRPAERDAALLVRRLAPLGDPAVAPEQVLREQALDAVRRDFEVGRFVIVDGWYLAETEARLCALSTFV